MIRSHGVLVKERMCPYKNQFMPIDLSEYHPGDSLLIIVKGIHFKGIVGEVDGTFITLCSCCRIAGDELVPISENVRFTPSVITSIEVLSAAERKRPPQEPVVVPTLGAMKGPTLFSKHPPHPQQPQSKPGEPAPAHKSRSFYNKTAIEDYQIPLRGDETDMADIVETFNIDKEREKFIATRETSIRQRAAVAGEDPNKAIGKLRAKYDGNESFFDNSGRNNPQMTRKNRHAGAQRAK